MLSIATRQSKFDEIIAIRTVQAVEFYLALHVQALTCWMLEEVFVVV